jgi:hypothetical protein
MVHMPKKTRKTEPDPRWGTMGMRDVDGSRSWQIAGRWGVMWSPRGRIRLFSERNGLAPSGWRDVRVGRTAELSFARLREVPR